MNLNREAHKERRDALTLLRGVACPSGFMQRNPSGHVRAP